MRGLPVWMLASLAALSVALLVVGWSERHEAGPFPFILGIVWALFTLAAVGAKAKPEPR